MHYVYTNNYNAIAEVLTTKKHFAVDKIKYLGGYINVDFSHIEAVLE